MVKLIQRIPNVLSELQDWTAVAQNTVVKSNEYIIREETHVMMFIRAALDTTTAHTGTRFIVQMNSNDNFHEDWVDLTEFIALVGTAATDLIENNPLAAGGTSLTLTAHALTVLGKWLFIEDATLIDSELVMEVSQSANAVVIMNGVKNAHAVNTAVFNVAMNQIINIPEGAYRIRLVVDNSYDADGSTLNYGVRIGSKAEVT